MSTPVLMLWAPAYQVTLSMNWIAAFVRILRPRQEVRNADVDAAGHRRAGTGAEFGSCCFEVAADLDARLVQPALATAPS